MNAEIEERAGVSGIPNSDLGGGYGINYRGIEAQSIEEFARAIVPGILATRCRLASEPRWLIVGNDGILVSRVLYTKQSGERRSLFRMPP